MHPHIIFFDGVCNLCNSSVNFIIAKDQKDMFRFASLQSDVAKNVLGQGYPRQGQFDTILYLENGKIFSHSTAVLRIARNLKFPWCMAWGLMIVPPFLRDFFYRIISRNRYQWFGRKDQCMIPSPKLKAKFLHG